MLFDELLRERAFMLLFTYITCRVYTRITRTVTPACFRLSCHNLAATHFSILHHFTLFYVMIMTIYHEEYA